MRYVVVCQRLKLAQLDTGVSRRRNGPLSKARAGYGHHLVEPETGAAADKLFDPRSRCWPFRRSVPALNEAGDTACPNVASYEDVELRHLNTAVIENRLTSFDLKALRGEVTFDPAYKLFRARPSFRSTYTPLERLTTT